MYSEVRSVSASQIFLDGHRLGLTIAYIIMELEYIVKT